VSGRRRYLPLLALALACAAETPALGQVAGGGPVDATPALTSGQLSGEHWAVQAMWRAEEMGLVQGMLPAQRLVPLTAVEAALRQAAGTAQGRPVAQRRLAEAWYRRFTEEFPGIQRAAAGGAASPVALGVATVAGGYLRHVGRAAPGLGEVGPDRTGALPRGDIDGAAGSAGVALSFGSHLALQAASSADSRGVALPVAELVGGWGGWQASLGRQAVGYGWARQGGVVLSGTVPADRIEVATRRPLHPPGILRPLGRIAFQSFLGRLPSERHPGRPYFWGARGAFQPHSRVTIAIQRAGMFGGNPALPVTARRVLTMLGGGLGGHGFDNQIVSVDGRVRLPTEAVLPLTASVEWGAEDAAGAFKHEPGFVLGLHAPALPGAPQLSLGVEYASISESCCGNPPWYRHGGFPGSWAQGDVPFGLPLGGSGSELLVDSHADLFDARLRLEGRAFRRVRRSENLYVPGREGRSVGLALDGAWRLGPGAEIYLSGAREDGQGWAEDALDVGGRLFTGH
jgi:hypothetical protein